MTEHDPFNEPEIAHPRARELMTEPLFWDCVDESAPFGSDEGSVAYYEWRSWREENQNVSLSDCFAWILNGELSDYALAYESDDWDSFTLDATIIATGLGQLMDEGTIDNDAKPFLKIAIQRQRVPGAGQFDSTALDAIERVVRDA
ncbi:molybdate metabolism regulator [Novipirellula sp. SH528]|uniref:molybdate metabolism regulator n=1 Tax=Novipirellula sp. SH528 TaxID=3454466 RepID=UPI003FA1877C